MWIKQSMGLFFGVAAGHKDKDSSNQGNGGLVMGNTQIQLGGLLGATVGFGERWGFYTGLMGALAFLPFLGFGFIGVPLGIHFNKKFGLGVIIPVFLTQWYIGLIVGIAAFLLARQLSKNYN